MRRKPVLIKEVVDAFLKEHENAVKSEKMQIVENWKNIISEKAAKITKPRDIRNKILTVEVSNSSWLYKLNMERKKILKKIEDIIGPGKVKQVRFKIGTK